MSDDLNTITPMERFSSEMRNGDNKDFVASNLINDPVWKSLGSASTSSFR
jgi:hypothetical protein